MRCGSWLSPHFPVGQTQLPLPFPSLSMAVPAHMNCSHVSPESLSPKALTSLITRLAGHLHLALRQKGLTFTLHQAPTSPLAGPVWGSLGPCHP